MIPVSDLFVCMHILYVLSTVGYLIYTPTYFNNTQRFILLNENSIQSVCKITQDNKNI